MAELQLAMKKAGADALYSSALAVKSDPQIHRAVTSIYRAMCRAEIVEMRPEMVAAGVAALSDPGVERALTAEAVFRAMWAAKYHRVDTLP